MIQLEEKKIIFNYNFCCTDGKFKKYHKRLDRSKILDSHFEPNVTKKCNSGLVGFPVTAGAPQV